MNIKTFICFLVITGFLLVGGQVIAQVSDYKKAVNAYKNGDYETAYKLIRPLADNGFAQAQYSLGAMYEKGMGVNASLKTAKKWFQLAAEKGISKAQYKLGLIYRDGKGVEKNYSKAIKWWKLVANKGNSEAQINLGLLFENGQGVLQDYSEAIRLYRLAVRAGNTKAQKHLSLLLNKKVEAQINLGLGISFETGQGVVQDYNEAIRWYGLAADLGFNKGKEKLDLLLRKIKKTKELYTDSRNLINLRDKKNSLVKDLQTIQPSLHSEENQVKAGEIKSSDSAKPLDMKIEHKQLKSVARNNSRLNAGGLSVPMGEFDSDHYKPDKIVEVGDSRSVKMNKSKLECDPLNNTIQNLECAKQVSNVLIREANKDHSSLKKKPTHGTIKIKKTLKRNDKNVDSKDFLYDYLNKWARAWENQDLESYFSFYAKNFKGLKNRHLDWRVSRRLILKSHTNISIGLQNIQISQNKDIAKTDFTQTFKSDKYSDIGIKELFWVKYGGNWRITSETWFPIKK